MYRSPNIVRVKIMMGRYVARIEECMNVFKIITGKPTGNRPSGRPWRRWEDNIRMNLEEIGINEGIELIRLRIEIIREPL